MLYSAETTEIEDAELSSNVASIQIVKNEAFDHFHYKSKPINITFEADVEYTYANSRGGTGTKIGRFTYSGSLVGSGITDDGSLINPVEYYNFSVSNITPSNTPPDGVMQKTFIKISDMEALFVGPFILPRAAEQIWYNLIFSRALKGRAEFKSEWWQVNSTGDIIPGTEQSEVFTYDKDTFEPQFYTRKITPSAGVGRYAFRISRTNNGKDDLSDQAKLESVSAIRVRTNVPVVDTIVRVMTTATTQATGYKERKFNAEATRKVVTWNGSEIAPTLSPRRSFADAILHSFTQVAGRNVSELDVDELYRIDAKIKANNEMLGWFDYSFDDKDISLGQRMQTICNAARVSVYRDGLKWRFVRDEKRDFPIAQFDARNLANDETGGTIQWKPLLPTSFDGVELQWVDSSDTNEDGTDKKAFIRLKINRTTGEITEGESRRQNKMALAGCRNYAQAMNRAQLEARRILYERCTVEDSALNDVNYVQKGDLVRWCDVYDEAVCSGEILAISGNAFYTNEELFFDDGKSYRVSITDAYGKPSAWLPVAGVRGNKKAFIAEFDSAYVSDGKNIQLGSRFIITPTEGISPIDFILTSKKPGNSPDTFSISLSQYSEAVYELD